MMNYIGAGHVLLQAHRDCLLNQRGARGIQATEWLPPWSRPLITREQESLRVLGDPRTLWVPVLDILCSVDLSSTVWNASTRTQV